jgi:hypothetical protein
VEDGVVSQPNSSPSRASHPLVTDQEERRTGDTDSPTRTETDGNAQIFRSLLIVTAFSVAAFILVILIARLA